MNAKSQKMETPDCSGVATTGRSGVPDDSIVDQIGGELASYNDLVLAYLFGSVARNNAGPLSDLDLAVLPKRQTSASDVLDRLQDALCRRFKTNRIDLIDLSAAPVHLAYQVIRDGHCLLCRDRRVKESFETRTIMMYLDFKPLRTRAFTTARRAILRAG